MKFKGIDLAGKRFGKLLAVRVSGRIYAGQWAWECKCDCGQTTRVCGASLRNGDTTSCGCVARMNSRKRLVTHGLSRLHKKAYDVWFQMHRRCNDPKNPSYCNYGGRGIAVCPEWITFEKFHEDMGDPPSKMSLERRDNHAGYCKENCYWTTRHIQNRNQRSNVWLEFKGERKIVTDWAKETGISKGQIQVRINKYGWSVAKALTTPVRPMRKKI